jgi:TolB-like protein
LLRRPLASFALAAGLGASLVLVAPTRAATDRVRVALLPIVVHSNDSREYLQQGLSDMLVSRLGRDLRLGVIKVEDPAKATTAIDKAREAGRAETAEYVVFGSFTRFGEGASLDLSVAKVASDTSPRQIFAHSDTLGGIIPMLDGVAEKTVVYVIEGAPSGPAVSAGPPGSAASSAAAGDGEVQELRRRVEALEHIVFTTNPVPTTKTAPVENPTDEGSLKRTFPGDHK